MTELRQKMIREMILRNFSPRTQESYIRTVHGLAKFYMRSPDSITNEEIKDYIYYLIQKRELAWNTCNVVINGIRFFL